MKINNYALKAFVWLVAFGASLYGLVITTNANYIDATTKGWTVYLYAVAILFSLIGCIKNLVMLLKDKEP